MSGSTPTSSPLELTPPATSYHADDDEETSLRTPESDSDSNSGYNAGQDGYELRPLSRSGTGEDRVDYTDEHGALIAPERDSDLDDEDGSAVVYDAFRESDEEDSSELRRRRRRRPGRKEFMYTEEEERKVVRKLDLHLVGFLALLYMLSFLDRSNIGNARIAGMTEDLELSGDQYEWLLTAFYITYISFEWMTLCYKVFPAHKYIACCVMGWGFVASMQGLATNWFSMLLFRALLGITEAAFGPGIPFYLSFFYRREELALRAGLFISAAPLATAYAGFLAYAITSIPSPISPWRLLFILEGFPSMVASIAAYYLIPDAPSTAPFLTTTQRKLARHRLLPTKPTTSHLPPPTSHTVEWTEVAAALKDAGNWITAAMYFFCNVSFSSLPVFLPTIIKDMGYTATHAQALSAPPYMFAFAMVLVTTWGSDRVRGRGGMVFVCCGLGALGYFLLAAVGGFQAGVDAAVEGVEAVEGGGAGRWWGEYVGEVGWTANERWGVGVKYVGVCMAAGGIFSAIALVMVWNVNNMESESGRGTGIAVLQAVGQCGPLLGTRLYPKEDGPYYVRGMTVCAGAMVCVCLLVVVQRWRLKRENRRRDRRELAEGREGKGFRFML